MSFCHLVPTAEGSTLLHCAACQRTYRSQTPPHKIRRTCTAETAPPREPPSLVQRIASFAQALTRHVASGRDLLPQAEIDARLAVCAGSAGLPRCELFTGDSCSACGCGCSGTRTLLNKLSLPLEECPLGKWPVVSGQ